MVVIKKDNNREPYDRSKIEGGILRACHKRPVSVNQIKRVVDEIEKEIFDREEKEISSSEIGELVIKRVHSLDPVAYVRFASVYREFKDVGTFMEELGKLLEQENVRGKTKAGRDSDAQASGWGAAASLLAHHDRAWSNQGAVPFPVSLQAGLTSNTPASTVTVAVFKWWLKKLLLCYRINWY